MKAGFKCLARKFVSFAFFYFVISCSVKRSRTVTEQQLIENTTASDVTLSYRKVCVNCPNGPFKEVAIKAGETQRVVFDSYSERTMVTTVL